MEQLTFKTASRFNRATPLFVNDPMVAKAINELAEKSEVKSEAKKLEAAVNNLSEIKYVNLELQKRYGFTNNLKLMMANPTIFNALLNSCLKAGTLDLEDFDYINVNLREAAKEYNKILISSYAGFVLLEKGKTYKEDVQGLPKLQKENGDLKKENDGLKKDNDGLKKDNDGLKLKEVQLSTDLDAVKASEKQLKIDLASVNASFNKVEADLATAKAEVTRLKEIEKKWKNILSVFNSGRTAAEMIKEFKLIIEEYVSIK
jgi:hypothetical protein